MKDQTLISLHPIVKPGDKKVINNTYNAYEPVHCIMYIYIYINRYPLQNMNFPNLMQPQYIYSSRVISNII